MSAIDVARAELGFTPRVSVEEGLQTTMAWYRNAAALIGTESK
jgi:nucleoside-diphosphate-sugar epimerase